jgi:hypothetical protein
MTGYSQPSGSEDRIEILIDQVGRLTEVVMIGFQDVRDEFREMRTDLAEIKEITRQQSEVAKQQAESVTRLVAIVENLMQRDGDRSG